MRGFWFVHLMNDSIVDIFGSCLSLFTAPFFSPCVSQDFPWTSFCLFSLLFLPESHVVKHLFVSCLICPDSIDALHRCPPLSLMKLVKCPYLDANRFVISAEMSISLIYEGGMKAGLFVPHPSKWNLFKASQWPRLGFTWGTAVKGIG